MTSKNLSTTPLTACPVSMTLFANLPANSFVK